MTFHCIHARDSAYSTLVKQSSWAAGPRDTLSSRAPDPGGEVYKEVRLAASAGTDQGLLQCQICCSVRSGTAPPECGLGARGLTLTPVRHTLAWALSFGFSWCSVGCDHCCARCAKIHRRRRLRRRRRRRPEARGAPSHPHPSPHSSPSARRSERFALPARARRLALPTRLPCLTCPA